MTSTPVSLNDDSLNGSWIDINSASQIHSPVEEDSPEFLAPPMSESMRNLGIISFQVERFLQEAQRNQQNNTQQNLNQTAGGGDDNSGIYVSDSDDISVEGDESTKAAMITSLSRHHRKRQLARQRQHTSNNNERNNNYPQQSKQNLLSSNDIGFQTHSKSGDCLVDQLSDSLSLLSRTSGIGEPAPDQVTNLQDFDWLWDWTAQPEYFSGQEWKVYAPKQDYLMRQRQLYCTNLNNNHGGTLFSGEVMSLLFLTNILSIIIGAGLTYSILMRRSTV